LAILRPILGEIDGWDPALRSQQNQTPLGSTRRRSDIEGDLLSQTADKQAFQKKAFERAHADTEDVPLKKNATRMKRRSPL